MTSSLMGKRVRMTSAGALVGAVFLLLAAISSLAAVGQAPQEDPRSKFLTGKLLIAAPGMSDPRFKQSVVYMVAHDEQGAFGLIINKLLGEEPVEKLMSKDAPPIDTDGRTIRIHFGGPVEFGQGFVLHTPDYISVYTIVVNDIFAMTPGEDSALLLALAKGKGPRKSILALGYAGWSPGQLESEMEQDAWVTATTDGTFVFDDELAGKWQRAYDRREFTL
ncbi:MAG: hypothetical protein CL569_17880 [Alphaproteobacteria bacterium]|nr:hypothetical protein [Alphaproteobacteria bacterium]